MDFEEYKDHFRSKKLQEELFELSCLNLPYEKVSSDIFEGAIFYRVKLMNSLDRRQWVPLFVEASSLPHKVFVGTLFDKGRRFSIVLLLSSTNVSSAVDFASSFFKSPISQVEEKDFSSLSSLPFDWQIYEESPFNSLVNKSVDIVPLSKLSKAQVSKKLLQRDLLVKFQLLFKKKLWDSPTNL